MRKIFHVEHNGILEDIIPHFEVVKDIEASDVVVLWQDVVGWCKSYAHLAKSLKKKIVVIQHGVGAVDDYGPPLHYELLADKICVWAPNDIDMLKRFGINKKKYELTGTTIWSHLRPREKHEGINVLFKPAHWDVEVEENYMIRDALRKIKGINVTTKTHECQNLANGDFDNVVFSNREEPGHLDICADVMAQADVIVGAGSEGTMGLMAYSQDIPVVVPDIWKPRMFLNGPTPEMKNTEACHKIELKDLESAIHNAVDHPEYKREERKHVAEYYGGTNIESPLDNIVGIINKI